MVIDTHTKHGTKSETFDVNATLFAQIISSFPNIQRLHFGPSLLYDQHISFDKRFPTVTSMTVCNLHVNLIAFQDCLFLLDGRFNQLHTLHVNIDSICPSRLSIDNKVSCDT